MLLGRNTSKHTAVKTKTKMHRVLLLDVSLSVVAGKEIDHKDSNPKNNNRNNLKCVARKKNRAKGARKTNAKR